MALKATLNSGPKRRKVQAPPTPEQAPHEPLPAPKQLGTSQKLTQVINLDDAFWIHISRRRMWPDACP